LKKKKIIIFVVVIAILLLGGYLILSGIGGAPHTEKTAATAGSAAEYRQRIAELEKIVADDPKNPRAWALLGNDYYDTDQPLKAISAYSRAIELDPANPNLLSDQGVMYKRVGSYDKALINFEKARKIDPKHLQSLFNTGIIYAEDLKRPDMAVETWSRYLELDSTTPAAHEAKRMIAQLKDLARRPVAK